MKVTVLYTIDPNATKWSEWEMELTWREALAYKWAVWTKKRLDYVYKLNDALERALEEIAIHENNDDPIDIAFLDPNYKASQPHCGHTPRDGFIVETWEQINAVNKLLRENEEEEKRNPTLELDLSGISVYLKIKGYEPSQREKWDGQWCPCDYLFTAGSWLHYEKENSHVILSCEVEQLADLLRKGLNGELLEKTTLDLLEPDFEFTFYPKNPRPEYAYVDWKVSFWSPEGLTDNYLSVTLDRAAMEKMLEYLERIMAKKSRSREKGI